MSSCINIYAQKACIEDKKMNLAEAANKYLVMSDAFENRILLAVSYLAMDKNEIPLLDKSFANLKISTLTVSSITFGQIDLVGQFLKSGPNSVEIQKGEFKIGVMTCTDKHIFTAYDLSLNVIANIGYQLQVIEISNNVNIKLTFTK